MVRVLSSPFVVFTFGLIVGVLATISATASQNSSVAAPSRVATTATAAPQRASVSDFSVPFAASEADALVPRGFLGSGSFGRLGMGCVLEVVKTTDRAALVKVVDCPSDESTTVPVSTRATLQGWVAKSALSLR